MGPARALLPARLERRRRAGRPRLPAGRRRPAARARARQRPAHRHRLPHAQGLAVRHGGQGQPRRRPQALLGGVLRGGRGAHARDRRRDRRGRPATATSAAHGTDGATIREACFWRALRVSPRLLEQELPLADAMAARLAAAAIGSTRADRAPRPGAPRIDDAYELAARRRARADPRRRPTRCASSPAPSPRCAASSAARCATCTRSAAARSSSPSADLLGSTSVSTIGDGFAERLLERDAQPGRASALASAGSARTPSPACSAASPPTATTSGSAPPTARSWRRSGTSPRACTPSATQARGVGDRRAVQADVPGLRATPGSRPARTGRRTPTRSRCSSCRRTSPRGRRSRSTPWEPQEVWTLAAAALAQRPAVISPFVTRPTEPVLDRPALGLAPAEAAVSGVYRLRATSGDAGRDRGAPGERRHLRLRARRRCRS